jgi:FixJ family two-component response regulator
MCRGHGCVCAMPDLIPIVYVVDDDFSVRESLEGLIHEAGWQSSVFASAEEFLSHQCPLQPNCLVLDVMLPGLNGLELQQQIAGERKGMPIIFITGYIDVPVTVRAMKAGAFEFLTKPFSVEVLLEAIHSALEHSRVIQGAATEATTLQR